MSKLGKKLIAAVGSGHTYPSRYPKGAHWATDEGWRIMDMVAPGAIPDDVRYFLSGCIAGAIMKARGRPR